MAKILTNMSLQKKHYACYITCAAILLVAYASLGTAFVGLYTLRWWDAAIDDTSRKLFLAFIWGGLGGTTYTGVYFAKDANKHREAHESAVLPNILEPPGYLLFIIASGFTGVLLVALVHAGFIAAYRKTDLSELSDFALFTIAFVGGYSADRVKTFCGNLSRGFMKDAVLPSEKKESLGSKNDESATER